MANEDYSMDTETFNAGEVSVIIARTESPTEANQTIAELQY